jgi:transcription initiation factor TFIIB
MEQQLMMETTLKTESIDYEILYMNRLFDEMKLAEKLILEQQEVDGFNFNNDDESHDIICCLNKHNHMIDEGRTICMICAKDIGPHLICNTSAKIVDKNQSNTESNGAHINPHLPDSSMGTTIRWTRNPSMMRMRRYQNWSVMPSKERSLYQVYLTIANICSKDTAAIPKKAQTTAKTLFQIISEKYTTRGAKRKGLIAACVYYACKMDGSPKDPPLIAELFDIRPKDLSTGIRTFQTIASGIDHPLLKFNEDTTHPIDYLGKYCTLLGITDTKVLHLAEAICTKIHSIGILEFYTPTTLAASVIYYILEATPGCPTIKAVSTTLNISSGTLTRCLKNLIEFEDDILPPKIVEALRSSRKSLGK